MIKLSHIFVFSLFVFCGSYGAEKPENPEKIYYRLRRYFNQVKEKVSQFDLERLSQKEKEELDNQQAMLERILDPKYLGHIQLIRELRQDDPVLNYVLEEELRCRIQQWKYSVTEKAQKKSPSLESDFSSQKPRSRSASIATTASDISTASSVNSRESSSSESTGENSPSAATSLPIATEGQTSCLRRYIKNDKWKKVEKLVHEKATFSPEILAFGLHRAVGADNATCVDLFIEKGASVNSRHNNQTPLHVAAANGSLAMVKKLLMVPGIDVHALLPNKTTARDQAILNGNTIIADLLPSDQKFIGGVPMPKKTEINPVEKKSVKEILDESKRHRSNKTHSATTQRTKLQEKLRQRKKQSQ